MPVTCGHSCVLPCSALSWSTCGVSCACAGFSDANPCLCRVLSHARPVLCRFCRSVRRWLILSFPFSNCLEPRRRDNVHFIQPRRLSLRPGPALRRSPRGASRGRCGGRDRDRLRHRRLGTGPGPARPADAPGAFPVLNKLKHARGLHPAALAPGAASCSLPGACGGDPAEELRAPLAALPKQRWAGVPALPGLRRRCCAR